MPVVGAQPENVPFSLKCMGMQVSFIGNIYVPMGKELQGPFQVEASSPMNIINFLLIFIISQFA
jgi:hypothetical protein